MSIEAGLKARLSDPQAVRHRLHALAPAVMEVYRDTYFERPGAGFGPEGCELRIRTVESANGVHHVLTFKEPPVHAASRSKPEYQTSVDDSATAVHILTGLGFDAVLSFIKQCASYRLTRGGREFLATVVTVPELEGTYLEVGSLTEASEVAGVLDEIRELLRDLGVRDDELTAGTYNAAVRAARSPLR